jgi:hypothetical protein
LMQIDLYHDHLPNLIKYLPQHKPFQWLDLCIETLRKVTWGRSGQNCYLPY